MALWSIYLAVAEDAVPAVRDAAAEVLAPTRYAIVTELLEGGTEGGTQLALDVEAGSISGAINVAQGDWARVQAAAGVPRTAAHLDFVVGPMDEPAPFHDQLLLRANELLNRGEPSYALVTAVSAFEVYERQAVRDMAARDMPVELVESVCALYRRANRTQQQRFFENLLGKKLEESGAPWTDYSDSLRRRQGIIHEGAVVDDATAASAASAVRNLIAWVGHVVQSRA
jgi:hypothetical protein